MVIIRYKCLVCKNLTDLPSNSDIFDVEEIKDYLCPECVRAIKWARLQMETTHRIIVTDSHNTDSHNIKNTHKIVKIDN